MYKNNKKTKLSRSRWATLVEFIHLNEENIKSQLLSAIRPDMIRADVMLDNVAEGAPLLSARTILPDGSSRVYVWSLLRPKCLFPQLLTKEILEVSVQDMLIFMANQVEVV